MQRRGGVIFLLAAVDMVNTDMGYISRCLGDEFLACWDALAAVLVTWQSRVHVMAFW